MTENRNARNIRHEYHGWLFLSSEVHRARRRGGGEEAPRCRGDHTRYETLLISCQLSPLIAPQEKQICPSGHISEGTWLQDGQAGVASQLMHIFPMLILADLLLVLGSLGASVLRL